MFHKLKNSGVSFLTTIEIATTKFARLFKKKFGVNLTDYLVDPINPDNIKQFLQNNASLHTDMNGVLKSQSSDLLDVDLTKPGELDSWINLNYQEHENAEQLLGI